MGDGTSIAPWCGGQLRVEGARGNGPGAGVCGGEEASHGINTTVGRRGRSWEGAESNRKRSGQSPVGLYSITFIYRKPSQDERV